MQWPIPRKGRSTAAAHIPAAAEAGGNASSAAPGTLPHGLTVTTALVGPTGESEWLSIIF